MSNRLAILLTAVAVLSVFFAGSVQAGPPEGPETNVSKVELSLEASCQKFTDRFDIAVYLHNKSDHEISVIGLNAGIWTGDAGGKIVGYHVFRELNKTPAGKTIIPAGLMRDIVRLRPDEVTAIFESYSYTGDDLPAETIYVTYTIAKEFGKRFDVWSGTLSVKAVERQSATTKNGEMHNKTLQDDGK